MPSSDSSSELFAPGAEAYYRKVLKLDKLGLRCTCGCLRNAHMGRPRGCNEHGFHAFTCDHSACGWKPRYDAEGQPTPEEMDRRWAVAMGDDEPPLTAEEEEEAPPPCDHCGAPGHSFEDCPEGEDSPPPQPERRPPYAVAYSVGGHLYEVALPGDATAQAVDGALIITHSLGQVAGIVRIMPMQKEAS